MFLRSGDRNVRKEEKKMAEEIIGIIGGTGLGDALREHISASELADIKTPFGRPSESIMLGSIDGRKVAFLNRHGPGHKLSPSTIPYAANIFALKKCGATTLIATGAAGSLRAEIAPGDLVIVSQFIDKTFKRTASFFNSYGAVHCEMAQPVCQRLGGKIIETGRNLQIEIHPKGCYVCIEGPQFSTQAESQMHRQWGADVVGMTAMPEAKLAAEAQMCYALVALISDYDCWREHETADNKQTLLEEIRHNMDTAANNCIELIRQILNSNNELVSGKCRCRKSLELAVWTQQQQIKASDRKKLSVLFE